MADIVSPEKRSQNMSAIRSKDTKPEVYLRKLLFAQGYRYRIADKSVPGHPDIFLRKYNTAIFVNGCFWHRHPGCKYAYTPKSRVEFWQKKFDDNVRRDSAVKAELLEHGIKLLTVWECAIRRMQRDKIEVTNTELTNAGGGVVVLIGGNYCFVHCTLANFMTLEKRTTPCLTMANNANEEAYPLKATFDNCIIDGSFDAGKEAYKGELNLSVDGAASFEYLFNHCVIKTNGSNNDHFKEVLFTNTSPSYRLKGGEKNKYRFDFRPDSLTTLGVGKADIFVTQQYPVDRYGINRLTNDGPDIGAYEFVPKEDETK